MENIIVSQLNPIPIDVDYNKNKILNCIKKYTNKNIDLIIFPSLFLYGTHIKDPLIKFSYISEQIDRALFDIQKISDMKVLISYPEIVNNELKETFVLISKGIIERVKTFEIGKRTFEIIKKDDIEDELFSTNADCLIYSTLDISRTNSEYKRNNFLQKVVKKQNKKLIYINQVGSQDEFSYDGMSRYYNEKGEIIALAKAFLEEDLLINYSSGGSINQNIKNIGLPVNLNSFELNYENDLERTYNSIIQSIRNYFYKNGFRKAVLGLSGGLDSTVCAVLLADALGRENVLGISMPSKLTSDESKNDAKSLVENLKINFIETPIKEVQDLFGNKFDEIFNEVDKNWHDRSRVSYTQDNIQARTRAMIIWGVANEYASTLPIATSDKSEAYMGYATVNGDMSGGFAPIADVTKTKLFALARWMNKNRKEKNVIPQAILEKPPGAELAINPETGKTLLAEEALMPYEFLDEVIWRIENLNQSIDDMMKIEFVYEKKNNISSKQKMNWLEKFFRRMNFALYKGYIMPPSPIVDSFSINKVEYKQPIVSKIRHKKK